MATQEVGAVDSEISHKVPLLMPIVPNVFLRRTAAVVSLDTQQLFYWHPRLNMSKHLYNLLNTLQQHNHIVISMSVWPLHGTNVKPEVAYQFNFTGMTLYMYCQITKN